jgi:hypothetical protein
VRLAIPLLALLCLGAATPEQLADAIQLTPFLVAPPTTSGDSDMFDVRESLGLIAPTYTSTMALMTTGRASTIEAIEDYDWPGSGGDTAAGDRAELSVVVEVPSWASSFVVSWFFLSREYPAWIGSEYLDHFDLAIDYGLESITVVLSEESAAMAALDTLEGSGFDYGGGTGWVTTTVPCEPGGTIGLTFAVYDVADGVWDSAALIDAVAFSTAEADEISSTEVDLPEEPLLDSDDDGWPDLYDCQPLLDYIHPGAFEICNGWDDDCDGHLHPEEEDSDSDGWLDCDDCAPEDPSVFPGRNELCDGIDTDCDPSTLAADGEIDGDGDGVLGCAGDCDDTDPEVHPGAEEICFDDVDQDCDRRELAGHGDPECWESSCLTSGGPVEAGLVLLALAGGLPLRRRRRGPKRARAPTVALLGVLLLPATASADEATGFVELSDYDATLCQAVVSDVGRPFVLPPGSRFELPAGPLTIEVMNSFGVIEASIEIAPGAVTLFDPEPFASGRLVVSGLLHGGVAQLWRERGAWSRLYRIEGSAERGSWLFRGRPLVFDGMAAGPVGLRLGHPLLGQRLLEETLEPGRELRIDLSVTGTPDSDSILILFLEWRRDRRRLLTRRALSVGVPAVVAAVCAVLSAGLWARAVQAGNAAALAKGRANHALVDEIPGLEFEHKQALRQERGLAVGGSVCLGVAVAGVTLSVGFDGAARARLRHLGSWPDTLAAGDLPSPPPQEAP